MIYLLEDDQNIRDFTIYAVQSSGMDIRGFALPSEFRSAVAEAVPDIVLLDILLPEEDGLSVLRWLRETPATKKLPIMMLSARRTTHAPLSAWSLIITAAFIIRLIITFLLN